MLSDTKTLDRGPSSPTPEIWRVWPSAAVATFAEVGRILCKNDNNCDETTVTAAPESRITSCGGGRKLTEFPITKTETAREDAAGCCQYSSDGTSCSSAPQVTLCLDIPRLFLASSRLGHK